MTVSRRVLLAPFVLSGFASLVWAHSEQAFADTIQYTYDSLGRLKSVTYPNGVTINYGYDAAGNRVQVAPPSTFNTTIPITGTGPVNLRTLADAAGYSGVQAATVVFTMAGGVTVTGTSGGHAVDSGNWPYSDYAISVELRVSGTARGGGGSGGNGANSPSGAGGAGGAGGDAVHCRLPMSVIVNTGGILQAGGGGGKGGSAVQIQPPPEPIWKGGGGGGGGAPNGAGGAGGVVDSAGTNGSPGTVSGGGAGGNPGGGAGGAYATAGAGPGGAAGFAIRKNGFAVTVTNNGAITGTVG